MTKLTWRIALLAVVAVQSVVAAGDVIEIRLVDDGRIGVPTTRPAATYVESPTQSKFLASIEALADSTGTADATCMVDGKTIHVKGQITPTSDGKRRVRIEFSHEDRTGPMGVSTVRTSTSVVVAMDNPTVITSLAGGASAQRLVLMTIKSAGSRTPNKPQ